MSKNPKYNFAISYANRKHYSGKKHVQDRSMDIAQEVDKSWRKFWEKRGRNPPYVSKKVIGEFQLKC
jgi:hypothetical protein|tara:strand:+ start:3100 stop:3300 length:201 start_codon:yes stop_codon:yes gene_type:complete